LDYIVYCDQLRWLEHVDDTSKGDRLSFAQIWLKMKSAVDLAKTWDQWVRAT